MVTYFYSGHSEGNTLGELIQKRYADFDVLDGNHAPMDMDTSHGFEVDIADNSKWGYGVDVRIYPFVEWSDGLWKPCHYWGLDKYIVLHKK